ncbi:hypothetical protein K502DRAFT_364124 [Neoconidiobolus thromboides FSU 785]|nr:hypothetical protein K502DRAFT_364124 [Neoconidiobolus thromboides FSU 785]
MSTIISATRKAALQQVIAKVFGHHQVGEKSIRTARKFLTPLKGPELLSYYPEQFNIVSFIKENPDLNLDKRTADEDYRLEILESRKKRGKGAPKKGQGRRSTIKKK